MNVRVWLRGLGLGRYEEKFRENKIDIDVLADLTDGDLQELGVSVGDRRRLLSAIPELGAQQPLTTQARPTPAAPAPAQSFAPPDSAERRPITVTFCDLVGSTELAAALDVEDWRNLVNTYLDEASRAVTRLGGHVLKTLGEGLMAVFGYPRAQEIEWWGNAEDAWRRSAFKEATAHLGKAIALADEAEREAPDHEAEDPALSNRRLRLHTDYGHAAMWLKGFAADEMSAAYARAGQFAGPADEASPRFVAYYGECLTSFMRGEHHQAHAEAEAFLREAEAEGRHTEAGVARRVLGSVSLYSATCKLRERRLSGH